MTVTAAPATKIFTDEMLAHNFRSIDSAFREVMGFMEATNGNVEHLLKKTAKSPSKVKPFLIGAAVGIVVLRTMQKRSDQLKKAMDDSGITETASQAVDKAKDVAQSTAKDVRDKL